MTDSDRAPVGAVEIAVLEFPGSQFNGQIVPALAELVEDGVVTILDLIVVARGTDGELAAIEIDALDNEVSVLFESLEGDSGGLLSEEDVTTAGGLLAPGTTAAVIVWENTWARKLIGALRDSGGRLVAHDRLDADTVAMALETLDAAGEDN